MDSLNNANRQVADSSTRKEAHRIRGLWIGFIVWVLILLNAIRIGPSIISHRFPLPIFAVGIALDLALAVVTLISLLKAYRKLRGRDESGCQGQGNPNG